MIDDFNREALGIDLDFSLPSHRVIRVLGQIIAWRGRPQAIRCDNGPQYISATLPNCASGQGICIEHIQPGKPQQNAYVERFNRTVRYEWLSQYYGSDLHEVREYAMYGLQLGAVYITLGGKHNFMKADMNGSITHLEIGAKSTTPSASKFFSSLFGWSFSPMEGGGGWFNTPTCKVGLHPSDPSPGIVTYFSVSDIEEASNRVRELGGEAGKISPEEPGFGRFCQCKDPEGVVFGLNQPSSDGNAA